LKLRESSKTGPNGPAVFHSHKDLIAINRDLELKGYLLKLSESINDTLGNLIGNHLTKMSQTITEKVFHTGKIVKLQEPGGKTRTIAIGDYYSQETLKIFHKKLMSYLKKLETDGTYDQSQTVSKMKQAMKDRKPIYCFDLTNATDRFPVKIQEDLMSALFGKRIASLWASVLTKRTFDFNGKDVVYAVGQPMGLLSSWAAFSLTHHAIIEYCALIKGFKSFKDYIVLGDDVAIFNKGVADTYSQMMKYLGVEISQAKSYI
jgi:hypothetical protein